LVEDAWQRRGLGGLMLDRLVAHAADHGIGALQAQMLTEQDWITGMLARHGSWTSAFGRGVREVTLHLGDSAAEASAAGALSLGGRGTG
jgi:GNAT superfamily N-acetyltransferase